MEFILTMLKKPQSYTTKRKYCQFTLNKVKQINYKDIDTLKKYINESCKIIPRRITGTKSKYQRQLARAIKIARFLALLPYTDQQKIVTTNND